MDIHVQHLYFQLVNDSCDITQLLNTALFLRKVVLFGTVITTLYAHGIEPRVLAYTRLNYD